MNLFTRFGLFILLNILCQSTLFAQKIDIKIQITDDLDLPAEDLPFYLITTNTPDSLFFKTDSLGNSVATNIDTTQTYKLVINDLRYKPVNSKLTFGKNKSLLTIHLSAKDAASNAVVITGQKPLFKQEEDKQL